MRLTFAFFYDIEHRSADGSKYARCSDASPCAYGGINGMTCCAGIPERIAEWEAGLKAEVRRAVPILFSHIFITDYRYLPQQHRTYCIFAVCCDAVNAILPVVDLCARGARVCMMVLCW